MVHGVRTLWRSGRGGAGRGGGERNAGLKGLGGRQDHKTSKPSDSHHLRQSDIGTGRLIHVVCVRIALAFSRPPPLPIPSALSPPPPALPHKPCPRPAACHEVGRINSGFRAPWPPTDLVNLTSSCPRASAFRP